MKKLVNIKGIKTLDKKQQESIFGGITLPFEPTGCGCIVQNRFGILEIIVVDCNSTCPDGSAPVPGLGF